jgi:hypothetical protein
MSLALNGFIALRVTPASADHRRQAPATSHNWAQRNIELCNGFVKN